MLRSCSKTHTSTFTFFTRAFATRKELETQLKGVLDKKDRYIHLDMEYDDLIEWLKDAQKVHPNDENSKAIEAVKKSKEIALKVIADTEIVEHDIRSKLRECM